MDTDQLEKKVTSAIKIKKRSDDEASEESDPDPLVEIQVNNVVRNSQISRLDVRNFLVRCSACSSQINHHDLSNFFKHRQLKVITCRECYNFYGSSEFSQDENGVYNYCTWCGQGGKLIVCDYCPKGFCHSCIRRNFGRAEVAKTQKEGWKCYCCNPSLLKPKQRYYRLIRCHAERVKYKKERKTTNLVPNSHKDTISPPWMQDAFNDLCMSCSTFKNRLMKLKDIESSRSKSLYHVIKKMEDVLSQHKVDLKSVMKKVMHQYSKYLSEQKSKEIIAVNDGMPDSKLSVVKLENTISDVKLNGTASELLERKTTTIMEAPISIKSEVENNVTEVLNKTVEQVIDSLDEENEKAKKLLMENESSSESESKSNAHFESESSDNENQAQAKSASRRLKFSDAENSGEISDLSENETASKTKSKLCQKIKNENESSSESTFGHSKLNNFHEKIFIKNMDYNDPKLKLKAVVVLERCLNLSLSQVTDATSEAKEGLKSDFFAGLNDMDKLEKVISNLEKFPEAKTVKKEHKYKPSSAPKKKPKTVKEEKESSSSICFSSDDENESPKEDIPAAKALNPNLLARKDLLQSDSSDVSSEDSDFQDSKTKKNTKSIKKKAVSSDDSFKPLKKKKHDKLLNARIKISDDSDEQKEKVTVSKKGVKRKVICSDDNDGSKEKKGSNSEHTTSTDSEDEKKKKKRKLKRIKKLNSSSSERDSDADAKDKDGTPGKGRKNIKKIISTKKLTEETKEAQMEEKERKKRIADRQKLYNKITDTSADGKETITRKLVLEVDPDSKEELVEISPDIVEKLKVHQVNGVKFMWESAIESLKKLNDNDAGSGCILAHCMGLGKTLQVITFLHTCMVNKYVSEKIRTAIVVCPYNTILNWAREFEIWQEDCDEQIQVHQLSAARDNYVRLDILKWWQRDGGVLIVSYDILRRLAGPGAKGGKSKIKAKMKSKFLEMLIDPGADIVVCDEGHVLKNEASVISKTMAPMRTKRRIVLTGTPLQNNLQEYHCMLSFVKPHLLGTSKEFRNRFVNPIQNGQYENSTAYDVKLMKKRTHILHKLLDGCVQRCDYSSLAAFLPPKHEFVISVKLSEKQIKMYRYYLDNVTEVGKVTSKGATLFQDFNNLRCIWTHPCMCRTSFERAEYRRMLNDWKVEEDEEFVNDESEGSYHSSPEEENNASSSSSSGTEVVKKYKTRSRATKHSDDLEEIGESSKADEEPEEKEWFDQFVSKDDLTNLELSGKLIILMDILKECESIGDKIIVFSQSLLTLDMIEEFLAVEASKAECISDPLTDVIGSWYKGRDYFRMDGSTSADFRKSYIDMFNDPNNDRARLFLISTKAGGLGTNLVGANRVVIFDASWNPSHDVQAIFRVYRFGQKKPVYIYRLLAQGTMEEKIYDRQITKLSMSFRVVDEQQIERHFTSSDLAELYSFNPDSTANRPTPLVPKDRLLAELLIKKQGWIVTYHEHDSLLQNETEADLTEEERQAAWQEYENEKDDVTFNNPGLSNLSDFCKEPDVNEADYEGDLLPSVHSIYNSINEHLKQKFPGISPTDMTAKILDSIQTVRSVLLNKQVDFLRKKQEFFAKGSVPSCINKYLGELSNLLRNISVLIHKLREHLQALYAKAYVNSNSNLNPNPAKVYINTAVNRAAAVANAQQMLRGNINLQNMQSQLRGTLGSTPGYLRQMPLNPRMYVRNYLRNPTFQTFASNVQPKISEEPIVTESDESKPTDAQNSNIPVAPNKSSVIIEEIS